MRSEFGARHVLGNTLSLPNSSISALAFVTVTAVLVEKVRNGKLPDIRWAIGRSAVDIHDPYLSAMQTILEAPSTELWLVTVSRC